MTIRPLPMVESPPNGPTDDSIGPGPRATQSLRARGSPLASTAAQLRVLNALSLARGDFDLVLSEAGWNELQPATLEIFQINLGRLCNMTCRHCHVDAGPDRTGENMDRETVDLCLAALDRTTASTVDITGGAPELNPHFRYLVDRCVERGKHVIDRCNLTILLVPRCADLPGWLAERGVEVVCSLPHYRRLNTDTQRGDGTFVKSIEALRRLNAAGYGQGNARRRLTLMSNPVGAYLAGSQAAMEREWKAGLAKNHGVTFDRLIALNNMPISRFLEWLIESGNLGPYMERLTASFNPAAVAGLMCRNTLSVAWDGTLHDCDFNQMLDIPIATPEGRRPHIRDFDAAALQTRRIRTARHCFGCTAGAGSSCGGATV
jgi:radical SAM/Cys-rich protein